MNSGTTTTLANIRPSDLPLELWNEILKLLSNVDKRTCLQLSRSFHDLTQPLLFSNTKICLGAPRVPPWRAEEKRATASELTQMTEQAARAHELLQHIADNTEFAHVIREMAVHACALLDPNPDISVFLKAFQNLTHLKTFTWRCSRPPLQPLLLEAIIKASGPTLTCVRMPASWQCVSLLARLPTLHRLGLARDRYEDGDTAEKPSDPMALDSGLFKGNGNTLRGIFLRGLGEADFLVAPLLAQCSHLRALSIHITTNNAHPLLSMLGNMHDALPSLVSFRLVYSAGVYVFHGGLPALASFLRNRRTLVRLDVTPDPAAKFRTAIDPTPVLEVLPGLTALKTLGIGMAVLHVRDEDLRTLNRYLPAGLSALLILFDALSSFETTLDTNILIDLIKRRPHLQYVHVWPPQRDQNADCYPRLLEQPLSMLRLVGWRRQLCSVIRDPSTGAVARTEPWPAEKIASGAADDFDCADWWWLLSAHVTDGPIETSDDDLWE
ncbi:hypothetical protein BC628DRAFT_850383 [Trametes gibbosa]|nr:hypothetical protein BC628DRAFT_850383 [Trametes gibbosa]